MSIRQMLHVYLVAGSQDCRHLGQNAEQNLLSILEKALKAGISCYQFRDKGEHSLATDLPRQYQLAYECQRLCRQYGVPFIINDDIKLATNLGADGIHIGQSDLYGVDKLDKQLPTPMMVGVSINTLQQASLWQDKAVDYFGVGPIFATHSKKDHAPPIGLDFIHTLRQNGITKPIVAIGSVKPCHVAHLRQSGADGVAVISAITQADDIDEMVTKLTGDD